MPAASFFADVFGCNSSAAACGVDCEHRPCFMDWEIVRHLKRGSEGWVVASGLRSRWNAGHQVTNRPATSPRGDVLGDYDFTCPGSNKSVLYNYNRALKPVQLGRLSAVCAARMAARKKLWCRARGRVTTEPNTKTSG